MAAGGFTSDWLDMRDLGYTCIGRSVLETPVDDNGEEPPMDDNG